MISGSNPTRRASVSCPLKPSPSSSWTSACSPRRPGHGSVASPPPPPPPSSRAASLSRPSRSCYPTRAPDVVFHRGTCVAPHHPRCPPARLRVPRRAARAVRQHSLRVRRGGGDRSSAQEGAPATPQGKSPRSRCHCLLGIWTYTSRAVILLSSPRSPSQQSCLS